MNQLLARLPGNPGAFVDDHLADVFAAQLREILKLRLALGLPAPSMRSPYERPKLDCVCRCYGCQAESARRWHRLDACYGCDRGF